jgi:hypothetical protein
VGALLFGGDDGLSDAKHYSNDQLAQITPYLTSGFTTSEGATMTFHGTVNPMWSRLPSDEKNQAARDIGTRLESQGVSTIRFYDFGKKLQFHYANGLIEHLE